MAIVIKYNIGVRIMHGLVGLAIICGLCFGFWMVGMPNSDEKWEYYKLHKSFGILVLIALFIRLTTRAVTDNPKSFYKFGSTKDIAEKIMYFGLYFSMFLMPISGYLMSNTAGYDVFMFGIKMPMLAAKNETLSHFFHSVHTKNAYFLVCLIVAHLAWITYRTVIKKHNILHRMI